MAKFLRLISDIHLDSSAFVLPVLETDKDSILVVAGDISNCKNSGLFMAKTFFKMVSEQFRSVVAVLGNHDYYYASIATAPRKFKETVSEFKNVYILQNESVILDDIYFHGCTFWTDCGKNDPFKEIDWVIMNDSRLIRYPVGSDPYGHKFTTDGVMSEHEKSKKFLKQAMQSVSEDKKQVVILHHAPSERSVDPFYKGNKANKFYFSQTDDLFTGYNNLRYVFHGHMHLATRYRIHEDFPTEVVLNPRGYVKYKEQTQFDPFNLLEI